MQSDPVFPEPARPLRPARGHLTAWFLGVVVVGLLIGTALAPSEFDAGLAGVAPEVVVVGFDGSEWRLSEHLSEDGRPVVLNLWASWCGPCREEIPELSAFASSDASVVVVGVAVNDQPEAAMELADELAPSYLVGMDGSGRLRDRYPSVGMPLTVLIDPSGTIVWSRFGGVTADELGDAVQEAVSDPVSSRKDA